MGANDFYNFSFSVPAGNTVNGIQVKLEASVNSPGGTIDAELSWDNGVSTTTPVKSTNSLTTTDTVYTLGSGSDKWGSAHTWVPGDFATFRLRLIGQPSSNTIQLDAIQVKVFHSVGGGGPDGGDEVYVPAVHNLAGVLKSLDKMFEIILNLFSSR